MSRVDPGTLDVIAPNFKRRHSGVTSTVLRLVPIQARDIAIAACGPALPPDMPAIPARALLTLSRRRPRVWHARRNVEMVAGLALKYLLARRLKLLFTSAAQRRHTGFTRWLIRRMDRVIATSGKAASYLEREATVVLHGVDCDLFHPAEDRAALRRDLDLPETGRLAGCFGRIRPQKGNDLFIDAMIALCAEAPDLHALMMGRATEDHAGYLADLKARVAEAGLDDRILFRDEVPIAAVPAHFRALDLYVAPQRWEGFGLTPLEAMASGVAVVATRAGAFEDMIVPGETGRIVDIDDSPALTDAIRAMLADPETLPRIGAAARAHVTAHFRIEKEAETLNAIYRALLAG